MGAQAGVHAHPTGLAQAAPCPSVQHLAELRGGAMGSSLHIAVVSDPETTSELLAWAARRVEDLEQRWSRFIPTSEVSRLNDRAGSEVIVGADTMALVQRAVEARELSGGRFDPTLLQAMQANGYDRTFVAIKTPVGLPSLDTSKIGLGEITIDSQAGTVRLGPTTGFDPGGIGKGLAADLVAEELIERGAVGALVNIGGDIRCIGHGPAAGAWVIAIGDAVAGSANKTITIAEGGVASSTRCRRRWTRATKSGPEQMHHLLDPRSGKPAELAANFVTVIAGTCADAEWLATAIAAEGAIPADSAMVGNATVLLTDHQGVVTTTGSPQTFLRVVQ